MKIFFYVLTSFCFWLGSIIADTEKLVILGSGPAGLSAAIFAGQSSLHPLVIEGDERSGQIFSISKIENYPGFPDGISGHELRERMHQQAEMFGARFDSSEVIDVDLSTSPFHIKFANGMEIDCESMIIATGSSPKWLGLESEQQLKGNGVSANALLEGSKFYDKEVVVVGGGDAALEQALLLTDNASKVTIVYKRTAFFASDYLQERVSAHPKITILLGVDVVDIHDASLGMVTEIILKNVDSKNEIKIPCEGVFIANGRQPNTSIFKGKLEMSKEGYFITKPGTTETSIPGVFIAGDISSVAYRKVITASASGCMSAMDAKRFFQSAEIKQTFSP